MLTAKIFKNGRSQAVRLPKEYRFDGEEVAIGKVGDVVIMIPQNAKWDTFMMALDLFSDDFMAEGREQSKQERESL